MKDWLSNSCYVQLSEAMKPKYKHLSRKEGANPSTSKDIKLRIDPTGLPILGPHGWPPFLQHIQEGDGAEGDDALAGEAPGPAGCCLPRSDEELLNRTISWIKKHQQREDLPDRGMRSD